MKLLAAAVVALLATPAAGDAEMVARTHVKTVTVSGGAGTQFTGACEPGETSISASFIAEETFAAAAGGYRKAPGVYAEGWRSAQAEWTFDIVNYATPRELRLTLTLMCYRGAVEEVRVEH